MICKWRLQNRPIFSDLVISVGLTAKGLIRIVFTVIRMLSLKNSVGFVFGKFLVSFSCKDTMKAMNETYKCSIRYRALRFPYSSTLKFII